MTVRGLTKPPGGQLSFIPPEDYAVVIVYDDGSTNKYDACEASHTFVPGQDRVLVDVQAEFSATPLIGAMFPVLSVHYQAARTVAFDPSYGGGSGGGGGGGGGGGTPTPTPTPTAVPPNPPLICALPTSSVTATCRPTWQGCFCSAAGGCVLRCLQRCCDGLLYERHHLH